MLTRLTSLRPKYKLTERLHRPDNLFVTPSAYHPTKVCVTSSVYFPTDSSAEMFVCLLFPHVFLFKEAYACARKQANVQLPPSSCCKMKTTKKMKDKMKHRRLE